MGGVGKNKGICYRQPFVDAGSYHHYFSVLVKISFTGPINRGTFRPHDKESYYLCLPPKRLQSLISADERAAAKVGVETTFNITPSAGGEGPLSVSLFRPSNFFATSATPNNNLAAAVQRLSHQSTISFFIRSFAFLDTYRPSRQREASSVRRFLSRHKPHICSFVFHEYILLLKALAYKFHTTASA